MMQQAVIPVSHASQVGEARRAAATFAAHADLDQTDAGRAAIIVTELANNLARYAKDGKILLHVDHAPTRGNALHIISLDAGPGMDVPRCMADGYSTGGTPGNGLGAVQRLASDFDIFSAPTGTALLASVHNAARRAAPPLPFRCGVISFPAPGEQLCGDAFRYAAKADAATLMIADGLGHGPDAAAAAAGATRTFDQAPFPDTAAFLVASHRAMSGSRGAAVAIAAIDLPAATLHFAGVGNIAATLFSPEGRRGLPSLSGIVGAILPKLKPFDYPLAPAGMLIMHSDGLQSRWSLDPYPGLAQRHPALIAAILYRDYYRGRDDVTIMACAWKGARP